MILALKSNQTALGKAVRLPLRLIPKGMVLPILRGPLRGKRWVVGSGTHGCWLGTYEADKIKLFAKTVKPGHVVYDIGANVGLYTLLASRLAGPEGKVFAFEPLPRNLIHLSRHVHLNHCSNVTILPFAVSDRSGSARFDASAGSHQGCLTERGDIEVQTVTLDGLLSSGAIAPPNILKVDVEGAEAKVLSGAEHLISVYKPAIFLATHGLEAHRLCCEWLEVREYNLQPLNSDILENADEVLAS
jgi:FkbM family methyltransferase